MGLLLKTSEKHSVQETIKLLTSNDEEVCDRTSIYFENNQNIPPYFNEKKFELGQQFYRKHIFAMLLSNLLGLVAVISVPRILNMLLFTKKSSDTMSSYKRYMATVFHMCVWYESDFKPDSKLWRSIASVKNKHNSASDSSCKAGGGRILQKDMGITQFGFMGFALIRPELIGIYDATREEQEAFVHFWKVIGHVVGIEERFNICRNSLEETKEICEALVENVFVPNIKEQNPNFVQLSEALINGMWVMVPLMEPKSVMTYLYYLLNTNSNNNETKIPYTIKFNLYQNFVYVLITSFVYLLKYKLVRWYLNAQQVFSFWLMRNFPFLAFYQYGFKNSYVDIKIKKRNC